MQALIYLNANFVCHMDSVSLTIFWRISALNDGGGVMRWREWHGMTAEGAK